MKTFTHIDWLKWIHLLGTAPDTQIAREIGCDRTAVAYKRKILNIPKFTPQILVNEVIICKCGCNKTLLKYDKRGRARDFLPGHWSKTLKITLNCDNCGKEIKRQKAKINRTDKHFCNHQCEGEYSTKVRRRQGKSNGHYNTITVPCFGCGTPVSKPESLIKRRNNRVYCQECIPLTRKGRKGFYVGYPKEFSPSLRHQIRKRDNFTCQNCGIHQKDTTTLHVHHIDYNKSNNNPENLISLCVTCHGQTNWATNTWKNKFTTMMNLRS